MRIIGLDLGKVSFKAVCLEKDNGQWQIKERFWKVHQQKIKEVWQELEAKWQINKDDRIVATGRLHRDRVREMLPFPHIPEKVAQEEAIRYLYPEQEPTLIRVGGGGFSVLKLKKVGRSEYKENPRCAAGVGSFLDQIIKRLGLGDIKQADRLSRDAKSLEITSRCGVTMKTDSTHLANAGYPKEEIVAGLFDSSAKNAAALALKSEISSSVLIIGGLSVSERIVKTIRESFPKEIKVEVPQEALYFEALGAALVSKRIVEENLVLPQSLKGEKSLTYLPSLKESLKLVFKMETQEHKKDSLSTSLIAGFDIGSTGSKLVVFDPIAKNAVFEDYTETGGQPIEAARKLIKKVSSKFLSRIKAVGFTGSGRSTVGDFLKASLSEKERERIIILNEIAAHAAGAHYYDEEVDTVVDIGGQDAKFTRLETGRVIDYCMNTVCSAGTGSFLAEQLQLLCLKDIKELGRIALESPRAVALGQHCAVFISEQIDEAKRKGANLPEIVAGLYYSIIENYDNRVKGFREYGKKIFLQGKPAENLALASALAKVTGNPIIVPPSPGTPGALGIAILTKKEMAKIGKDLGRESSLSFSSFLDIPILEISEFECLSKDGCLYGNRCRIKKIKAEINGQKKTFFFGGSCDKWERRPGKESELAKAPHPFIEREGLIQEILNKKSDDSARTVAIPRGLETEEILPFAVIFFRELGFKVKVAKVSSLKYLEEGAKLCQTTFCAPFQLLGGQAKLFENEEFVFLPKVIEIAELTAEPEKRHCYVCPLSQAMPDLFAPKLSSKVLRPLVNFKNGWQESKKEFLKIGEEIGCSQKASLIAFAKAIKAQGIFEEKCRQIGERALTFANQKQMPLIVVLGHPYVINSPLLSAGIPETIQENGALALPADCYPLAKQNLLSPDIYWGYGQRLLQATHQIRRQAGVYPLWLSVYSCGPDSFLIHFFQYLSQGKPYTFLESDAYTGQAGFKTRVEAFLYGIENYQPKEGEHLHDLKHFSSYENLRQIKKSRCKVLIPWMGESAITVAAVLRSSGVDSEALPLGRQENLEMGRKYTSGKECLPMIITLGGLLKCLEAHPDENFYYFMPQASGPCRFGQYHLLFQIILEKMGLSDRVKVISPSSETGYQYELQIGPVAMAKAWAAALFVDFLKDALYDIRPEENIPGITQQVFDLYLKQAEEVISKKNNDWFGLRNLWGLEPLAKLAARHFKTISKDNEKQGKPIVLVTGEIFMRLNRFANNEVIKELEKLGVKVKLSPFREWGNYVSYLRQKGESLAKVSPVKIYMVRWFQRMIERRLYRIFAKTLGWPKDHQVEKILETAEPYLSEIKPLGEAALTIGLPLLLWQKREIDGVVTVGPFECMPSRIAETQLNLISQQTDLPVLNLSFYGEPLERDALESFIWDIKK